MGSIQGPYKLVEETQGVGFQSWGGMLPRILGGRDVQINGAGHASGNFDIKTVGESCLGLCVGGHRVEKA